MREGANPAETRSPKVLFDIRNRQVGSGQNLGPKEVDLGSNHLITVDRKKGNSDHAGAATLY
jgi:hypothetical protein